jgi:hypothetical protein
MEPKPVLPDASGRESEGANPEEKKTRSTRGTASPSKSGGGSRFFLAGGNPGKESSTLALGEEYSNEDAVMVASFQKDLPFYRVETWKVRAEKKGRQIVLRRQS